MSVKGFVTAAMALSLGLMLGSCSPFSGFVSDHWPHIAGGEPNGTPPRPGTPGYAAFIAHGDPNQPPDAATSAVQPAGPMQQAPIMQQRPAAAAQTPAPAGAPPASPDDSVVQGGLY